MDQTVAVVIIGTLALAMVVLASWMVWQRRRTTHLRQRFGPEYDKVVSERGSPRRGESELRQRARRVERLPIRPLSSERCRTFADRWKEQQARFVEEPTKAVDAADHLVKEVMEERGYPVGEFDQRAADISVDHPRVVENYRAANNIADRQRRGQADTEDLRKAMVHYRALFMELLEEPAPQRVSSR